MDALPLLNITSGLEFNRSAFTVSKRMKLGNVFTQARTLIRLSRGLCSLF